MPTYPDRSTIFSPKSVGRVLSGYPHPCPAYRYDTILRAAFLGNIHPAHDLYAAYHLGNTIRRNQHHLLKHAIDTEPHAHLALKRLHMNVARPKANRLMNNIIHHGYGRIVPVIAEQVTLMWLRLRLRMH
ncbi:MAG: hypothetical protein U5L04_05745 [Trueperaceae bacterium]|nr:hypothetical protein [Trueperaceae bacterium]